MSSSEGFDSDSHSSSVSRPLPSTTSSEEEDSTSSETSDSLISSGLDSDSEVSSARVSDSSKEKSILKRSPSLYNGAQITVLESVLLLFRFSDSYTEKACT